MAYGDFKYLTRRTASDKYCLIKHLILLKIQFMVDKCLVSMVRKFFDKKSSDGDIKNKHLLNQLPLDLAIWELAE